MVKMDKCLNWVPKTAGNLLLIFSFTQRTVRTGSLSPSLSFSLSVVGGGEMGGR